MVSVADGLVFIRSHSCLHESRTKPYTKLLIVDTTSHVNSLVIAESCGRRLGQGLVVLTAVASQFNSTEVGKMARQSL